MSVGYMRTIPAVISVVLLIGCARNSAAHQPQTSSAAPSALAAPSGQQLPGGVIALDMVTPEIGWAESTSGILRTTDAARKWTMVSPSGFTPAGTAFYPSADFQNSETAWVLMDLPSTENASGAGVGLAHTTDGGQTWSALPLPKLHDTGYFLSFPDAKDGFLMGVGGAAMHHMTAAIYATTTGGQSWSQVEQTTSSVVNIAPGTIPDLGDKLGLSFWNSTNGWVTLSAVQNGVVGLYHTTDGGRMWSRQNLPSPSGVDLGDALVQFLTAPVTFGAGRGAIAVQVEPQTANSSVSQPTIIYVTNDGGNTWTPTKAVDTGFSNTAFLPTATDWWLQNQDTGGLWRTSDGGKSWVALKTKPPTGSHVGFVNGTQGFAWKGRDVWKTTDGGLMWRTA